MRRAVLLSISLLLAGCALDRSGLALPEAGPVGVDAGRRDGGRDGEQDASTRDAGTSDDDAGGRDAGPRDSGLQDSGLPDSGLPDAGIGFCQEGALAACVTCEGTTADRSAAARSVDSDAGFGAGPVGSACVLGAGTRFVVAHGAGFPSVAMTLEAFVRADAVPSSGRAGIADWDGVFGVFVFPGGDLRCTAGGATLWGRGAIAAGRWTHVACVADGARARLFVDGVQVDESAMDPLRSSTAPLRIGEDSPGGGDQLVGAVDELRLFSSARSAAQIAAAAAR
ncbi:MAG: LamG domain-containing protein [Myxococcota bacterium]|nr:LamG domain-containing protein [Myxococcota bacterium]